MAKRASIFIATALLALAIFAPAALAHDHLFNATNAPGSAERGFTNPVALNPSGTSGPASSPATVPGGGDPKVGVDLGTPAADLTLVPIRSGR